MSYKLSSSSEWTTLSAYSTTASKSFTPAKSGTYTISVKAKDDVNTVKEQTFTLTVKPGISSKSSILNDSVTLGESIIMLGNSAGGKAPITFKYQQKLSTATNWTTVADYSANGAAVFTPTTEGKYDLRIIAKDALGKTSSKTFTATVTGVLANTSTLSADSIKVGEKVTVKASATGGKGSYTYAYYSREFSQKNWTTISGYSSTATATFAPQTAGYYQICVKVKDDEGTVAKEYYNVVVNADQPVAEELKNTSVVEPSQITLGERVNIKASAQGGTAPYTYAVLYKKKTDTKWTTKQNFTQNTTVEFKPENAVEYDVCIKVKDSNGTIVKKFFDVTVSDEEKLTSTSTISATTITKGQTVTVYGVAVGGKSPYTYAVYYKKAADTKWTTKQDFAANDTVTIKPAAATDYDVCIKIKDAEGTVVKQYFKVAVTDVK